MTECQMQRHDLISVSYHVDTLLSQVGPDAHKVAPLALQNTWDLGELQKAVQSQQRYLDSFPADARKGARYWWAKSCLDLRTKSVETYPHVYTQPPNCS